MNRNSIVLRGSAESTDGHRRITEGEGFKINGGSQDNHDLMVEKAVKVCEKLSKRGKNLHTATCCEFFDSAQEVGLLPEFKLPG